MHIISSKMHTWAGVGIGLSLLVAPWILSFDQHLGPRAVAVSVGLLVLLSEAVTTSPTSPLKIVPMWLHARADMAVGAFLAMSPWLLQFFEHGVASWLPHLLIGLVLIAHALATGVKQPAVATSDERVEHPTG